MIYYLHCTKCHHEWDSVTESEMCDWCGGDSYILTVHKPFDWFAMLKKLIELKDEWANKANNKIKTKGGK